jgi:hypothetical protein
LATAVSRRKPPSAAVLDQRRRLCQQLLDLNIKHKDLFAEISKREAELKELATKVGESFKEDFGAKGYVSASGKVEAEFKGNVPVIDAEIWNNVSKTERARLEKSGLIIVTPSYSKVSNGRVTVKVL